MESASSDSVKRRQKRYQQRRTGGSWAEKFAGRLSRRRRRRRSTDANDRGIGLGIVSSSTATRTVANGLKMAQNQAIAVAGFLADVDAEQWRVCESCFSHRASFHGRGVKNIFFLLQVVFFFFHILVTIFSWNKCVESPDRYPERWFERVYFRWNFHQGLTVSISWNLLIVVEAKIGFLEDFYLKVNKKDVERGKQSLTIEINI